MNHIIIDKFYKTPSVVIDDVFYYGSKDEEINFQKKK